MVIGNLKSGVSLEMNKVMVHEAYCYRHMTRCKSCNEMINRKNEEEHIK